jgi:nicotinamidase-related amidase
VESTVRFAAELGYEVTMVKDATASFSDEEMHAALEVNIPNYASAMVTTTEIDRLDLFSLNHGTLPNGRNKRH